MLKEKMDRIDEKIKSIAYSFFQFSISRSHFFFLHITLKVYLYLLHLEPHKIVSFSSTAGTFVSFLPILYMFFVIRT